MIQLTRAEALQRNSLNWAAQLQHQISDESTAYTKGYGCVRSKIATRRTGLNGLRINSAFVALNRNIVLSLPTTMNVYNRYKHKKLSYRRGTARRAVSVESVLNVAQMFIELHFISPALRE